MAKKEKQIAHKRKQAEVRAKGDSTDAAQGTGPANRHGMPQVPPKQHVVKKWPVLDLGVQPEIPLEAWRLEVKGEIERPCTLDWEAFNALPQTEDVSDFHCVTTWSHLDNYWRGVSMRTLAEVVRPTAAAKFVFFTAYDDYTTNLPLEDVFMPDVLLVHTWENAPLTREHGGPVRVITPRKYAWKGAKWVKEIYFLAQEELGYWEQRGYSNTAEPWTNDRYIPSQFSKRSAAAF